MATVVWALHGAGFGIIAVVLELSVGSDWQAWLLIGYGVIASQVCHLITRDVV